MLVYVGWILDKRQTWLVNESIASFGLVGVQVDGGLGSESRAEPLHNYDPKVNLSLTGRAASRLGQFLT